jgi:hypothetical protein
MNEEVQHGIWRHFKGKEYLVEGEYADSETGAIVIPYRQLYAPYKKLSRPKSNFLEHVDRSDFNYSGPRFVLVRAF